MSILNLFLEASIVVHYIMMLIYNHFGCFVGIYFSNEMLLLRAAKQREMKTFEDKFCQVCRLEQALSRTLLRRAQLTAFCLSYSVAGFKEYVALGVKHPLQ